MLIGLYPLGSVRDSCSFVVRWVSCRKTISKLVIFRWNDGQDIFKAVLPSMFQLRMRSEADDAGGVCAFWVVSTVEDDPTILLL